MRLSATILVPSSFFLAMCELVSRDATAQHEQTSSPSPELAEVADSSIPRRQRARLRARLGRGHQRQAHLVGAEAEQRAGIFDRRRARLARTSRRAAASAGPAAASARVPGALQAGVLEIGAELGRDIGRHRDAAMPAMRHVAERGAHPRPRSAASPCRRPRARGSGAPDWRSRPSRRRCSRAWQAAPIVSTEISTMARPGML